MTTITIDRAVVEQALEALEADCGGRCNAEYNPCWQREVAETLHAALAQQAEPVQEPVAQCSFPACQATGGCVGACTSAALAQQAEPVGVVSSEVKGGVIWYRWPDWMPDGTKLYADLAPLAEPVQAKFDEVAVEQWKLRMVFYDENGEPLMSRQPEPDEIIAALAEPVLQGPVAWRYWKQKWNCWEYSDTKLEFPAVPAGTKMEPLYLVSPEVKSERLPVGTVHNSVKGGVVWNRWPDEMEDGTHLYVNPPPCQTCEALARTVLMDQMGRA